MIWCWFVSERSRDVGDRGRLDQGLWRRHLDGVGAGGISSGEDIVFRVAFKPTATIMSEQDTVTSSHENTELKGRGRHDACVLPRAVPIVEAMATLVLTDHFLRQRCMDR